MKNTEPRPYESPLRAEQRERTRERIIDAAIEQLADEGLAELTIPLVARRAAVSVRTVYVHFATKEALLDAVGLVFDERFGIVDYPERVDEIPEVASVLWARFDEHEQTIRAAIASRGGREMRAVRRRERIARLERALEERTRGLSPSERKLVGALVYLLHSAPAWQVMRDYFGLGGKEAGPGAAWAVRALLAELERNPRGPIR